MSDDENAGEAKPRTISWEPKTGTNQPKGMQWRVPGGDDPAAFRDTDDFESLGRRNDSDVQRPE